MTLTNLKVIENKNSDYTITRLERREFVEKIISSANTNILKDYVYVEARRVIA